LPERESHNPPIMDESGQFIIHQARDAKLVGASEAIEGPHSVKRQTHVEIDETTGEFIIDNPEFLPPGWREIANRKFGVPPSNLPTVELPQYQKKIPLLLVQMKQRLIELDGFQETGIFRLAPDASECNRIKAMMNSGQDWMEEDVDVNVMANLIKVWFRELPKPILNIVPSRIIEMNQTQDKVAACLVEFPDVYASLLEWLWDFCVEVADHSGVNKMPKHNLAIVIGPNLFNTDSFDNPMKAMDFSGKVVTFFEKGISWRQSLR